MRTFSERYELLELGARYGVYLLHGRETLDCSSAEALNLGTLLLEGLGSRDDAPQVPLEVVVRYVRGQMLEEGGLAAEVPRVADEVSVLVRQGRGLLGRSEESLALAVFLHGALPVLEEVEEVLRGSGHRSLRGYVEVLRRGSGLAKREAAAAGDPGNGEAAPHPSHQVGVIRGGVLQECGRCGASKYVAAPAGGRAARRGGQEPGGVAVTESLEEAVLRRLGVDPGEAGDKEAREAAVWARRGTFEDRAHVWARLRAWCEWWERVDPALGAPAAYQSVLIVGGAEAVPWVSERISSASRGIAHGALDAPLEWALEGLGRGLPLDESISAPLYALVSARLAVERGAREAGDEEAGDFVGRAIWALGALAGDAEVPGTARILGWAMGSRRHFDHIAGMYGAKALVGRWQGIALAGLAMTYRGPVRYFARVVCGWGPVKRGNSLEQDRKEREVLLDMFQEVDGAHSEGRFGDVDERLKSADPEAMGIQMSVGLLAITLAAADKLAERGAFARRVRAYLERVDPERVNALLLGLEG